MNRTEAKRQREKRIVAEMIALYCRNQHKSSSPCPECAALIEYAHQRSDKCLFMESKTFCSNCRVHCYRSDMREQIRRVMRYSGPRMIRTHPILAMRHLIESKLEKRRLQG
ncbi:MAG: nitrous oxide-stimulated promoter family protein [Clostridia bacterium]|nr:nitrous oxide-stimulated promoter family protein [Clostridia bacterium]